MRNSSTHSGNLANEIALLKKQLDDLSSSVSDSASRSSRAARRRLARSRRPKTP